MTSGRNDPCSCGSGKKFKRCCQPNQEVISPEAARSDNLFTAVWHKLSDFMGGSASEDAVAEGFGTFFLVPPSRKRTPKRRARWPWIGSLRPIGPLMGPPSVGSLPPQAKV